MNRIFLMAAVSALAISAPAQADKGGRHGNQDPAAQQAQPAQDKPRGGGHQQRQQQAPQVQQQRAQRSFENRGGGGGMQRVERARPQQQLFQQRARPERQVFQQQRMERVARPQRQEMRVDNRARYQDRAIQRQARQVESRKQMRQQQVQTERFAKQNRVERQAIVQRQRATDFRGRQSNQRAQINDRGFKQQMSQQRQAERFAQSQQRFDRRSIQFDNRATRRAMFDNARRERLSARPAASVGERVNLRQQRVNQNWDTNFAEQRGRTFYNSSPDFTYDYNNSDGYLYQVNRNNDVVTGLFPVLGGAFGVGRALPIGYDNYNVPYGYRSLYYDTPDYYYRYGDGGIYRVDRDTQLIQAVAALLTGQSLGIGQRLPLGYDVYNVPYAYRDRYYDTSSMWYRYDDGTIYGIDPYSRMIQSAYPVSYGYTVGYPVPAYASYGGYNDYGYGGYGGGYDNYGYGGYDDYSYAGYGVPYGYNDLYYAAPGYNYQYANYGIYQVDPTSQLVSALVALVTGNNLGIGQTLPLGYDAYNVPQAYRASYYDTPDTIYRYDDGNIYGANPRTRVIETAIPVAYNNGFAVGYPVPADYPGYAVPPLYSDLYYAQPGFDYRYANGGIYQIDPQTRMVEAIAALLTGQTFGVGQALPVGYDAYNVPYAYRSQYADTADNWYRYADGNIYQVDPQTRLIRTVVSVA